MSDEKKFLPHRISIYCSTDISRKGYVSFYDDDGKRQRVYGDANQAKDYATRLQRLEALRDSIIDAYRPVRPIEERALAMLEDKRPDFRKKTYYGYSSKLGVFLRWKGKRPMSKQVVGEFFQYLDRSDRVGNSTRNDYRRILAWVFDQLGDDRFFADIEDRRYSPKTRKHFQRHQIGVIRQHLEVKDPNLWFMCQCVYYLFIRPNSELRLLKVMHFELDDWRVNIPPDISKTRRNEFVIIPKSFRDEVLQFLHGRRPGEYLFPGVFDQEKPIGPNTMMGRFRKELDLLGFGREYSMYSWKNTGAIACVKAGVHPKILQIQLRHSSLEMTDRYLKRMGILDVGDLAEKFPSM